MALFSEYEDLFLRSALMAKSPLNDKERRTLLEAFLSVCEWVKVCSFLATQSAGRGG